MSKSRIVPFDRIRTCLGTITLSFVITIYSFVVYKVTIANITIMPTAEYNRQLLRLTVKLLQRTGIRIK